MSNYTKPVHVSKRVRFYDGQFLQDQDFIDEQNYHLDRQARIGRALQVAGIVEGLEVTVTGETLSVTAGTAVDLQGHALVLADSRTQFDQDGEVIVRPATEPFAIPPASGQSEQYLYLAYCQVPVDLQQGEQGLQGETRWQEAPFLFLANGLLGSDDTYDRPPWDEYVTIRPTPVLLTRLQINANGQVVVTGPRVYSGLRLAGPGGGASWVMDEDGRVQLRNGQDTPPLSIIGDNVGIGTADPGAYKLNVSGGDTLLDGSLSVKGISTLTGNVGIGTANPGAYKLNVSGGDTLLGGKLRFGSEMRQMVDLWDTRYGIGVQEYTQYFRTNKNFAWYKDGSHDDDELQPGSGGTVQMVIKDGYVGIGTTTPQAALQVRPLSATSMGWAEAIRLDHPHHAAITHPAGNLLFGMHGINKKFYFADANINDKTFTKYLMIIEGSTGNVGIGPADPGAYRLNVSGGNTRLDGTYIEGQLWVTDDSGGLKRLVGDVAHPYYARLWPSDERLKQDIQNLRSPLEKVCQLRGVSFKWNEAGLDYFTQNIETKLSAGLDASEEENKLLWQKEKEKVHKKHSDLQIGLIAQNVRKVIPEIVKNDDDDDFLKIDYQQLTALLVAAINEQNDQISRLESRLSALENG